MNNEHNPRDSRINFEFNGEIWYWKGRKRQTQHTLTLTEIIWIFDETYVEDVFGSLQPACGVADQGRRASSSVADLARGSCSKRNVRYLSGSRPFSLAVSTML